MARRKDLEQEIQQQMIAMIAQVVLFNHAANSSLGLGASDSQFLTLLRTRGPMTPGQLADATGLTSGTVTGVIDRLEKADLVRRERVTGDRRKVLVVPTPDAAERLAPTYAGQAGFASGFYDLDFNRAYHPYCVYNPQYDCPYPPRENRLSMPIRSGERLKH